MGKRSQRRKPKGIKVEVPKAIIKGEFDLPEPIIQHIQSFLAGKEAAQTTILSKSWHSAWLTRPDLYFHEGDFKLPKKVYYDSDYSYDSDYEGYYNSRKDRFLEFAKMTIQRYEQSNLKIETLRLRISSSFWRSDGSNDAHDLIVRALKIGVTHLSLQVCSYFVLPREVFESGNLVELSVEGGKIDLKIDQEVTCPKLESLSLSKVEFDISFLADLSSKFPSLEDLTLDSCGNVLEICSRSLLRLTLIAQGDMKVKFDVPRIQKFTFEGSDFPSMSFETTSREWESHVSINHKMPPVTRNRYQNGLDVTLGFSGLERILTDLRGSKIHISLGLFSDKSLNYEPRDIHGLSKLQVENVTMDLLPSSSCCALYPGLFKLCRPKFITRKFYPENISSCKITRNNFLCLTRVSGMTEEFSSLSNFMHGVHGLEEVTMEIYDEDVAAWRSLPLESIEDGSTIPEEKQNFRFQLKWKP